MSKEKFVRDKPHVNITTIAVVIIMALSAVSVGMTIYVDVLETRDSDGDSIPDQEEIFANTPLYFDVSDESLFFRTYETGTSGHELGHNLGISHDGLSSHVNVNLGLFDDVATAVPVLEFSIKYDSLIEFVDGDSNGFFDPGTDTIIGKTVLNNMLRTGFGYGIGGEPVYYSNYSTIDGVFKVDFFIAREHVLLGRQVGSLSRSDLKSMLRFTGYTPITGGTSLALNLSLSSSHDIAFSGTSLTAIASTGNYEVEYQWYDTATINGLETTVNSTVPSSPIPSTIGSIYINFGPVVNGKYDPKLHWELPRASPFNIADIPWSYIALGSLAILLVGVAIKKKPKTPRGKAKKKHTKRYVSKPPKTDSKGPTVGDSSPESTDSSDHIPRKRPGRLKYEDPPPPSDTEDKVPRKKPGRVKFDPPPPPKEAPETDTRSEKRIPKTLRHRDR